MKGKGVLIAAVTAAVVLATGAAIAWAATGGAPRPARETGGFAMRAMHTGMNDVDADRMVAICRRAMKVAATARAHTDGHRMTDNGHRMMDDGPGAMMGGAMMGGGMMGGR